MGKSSNLINKLRYVIETHSSGGDANSAMHKAITAAQVAALNAVAGGVPDVDTNPPGEKDLTIRNFVFDPYGVQTSWSEMYHGKECLVQMFVVEYQSPQAVDNHKPYHPGQGIHLIVTHGNSRFGVRGGTRLTSSGSKRYVHRTTYRGLDNTFYLVLSDLSTAARKKGLDGIKFPQDWDEIPYD